MNEARFLAHVFGQVGEEGDHVVVGLALDLVDTLDLEGAALPHPLAAASGITPSSAWASQAWASISNQMRNLFSGAQMAAISGRE